jgi:hypothetical protein
MKNIRRQDFIVVPVACALAFIAGPALAQTPPAPSVGAQPVTPEARGFNAPTLDGDWRFRLALNGWIPDSIPLTVNAGNRSGTTTLDIGFILDHLGYAIPIDAEARKGTFGIYAHTMAFKVVGTVNAGPAVIRWSDNGFLMDLGLSYELGSWDLGGETGAPVLTVEPFAGARLYYSPVDLSLARVGRSTTVDSFTNYVPDIGIRTFWDLTEHWNLRVEGDGGGFGVDDNQQTWQAVGLIGYRWPAWGVHWNVQAGYRAMRLFDLKKNDAEIQLDVRGPDVILALEF